jgi:hypothetical protein
MLTSASDLVAMLDTIHKVSDHTKLDKSDKQAILEEMRHELPAEQLCRFSKITRGIVSRTLDEAINAAETKGKSPTQNRSKASPESSEDKLLRGARQNTRRKSIKSKVG